MSRKTIFVLVAVAGFLAAVVIVGETVIKPRLTATSRTNMSADRRADLDRGQERHVVKPAMRFGSQDPPASEAAAPSVARTPQAPPARAPERPTAPKPPPSQPAQTPAAKTPIQNPEARGALSLVGLSPAAEAVWLRAINDPDLPAEERKDLIEDLNEDGFADPGNVTENDLPLILSRIELIERLWPESMDAVNEAAFREAYKDLVNMYERLVEQ
jgi:hypothetical protein